ncbi:MAG: hypothetical protein Salg2KO_22230 [Salibacteraceae bacterium]
MKKIIVLAILMVFILMDGYSQCAMCGAVAETAQKNGSDVAEGLNAGILYLMGIPYILLMGIGVLMFRKLNQNRSEQS